MRRMIIPLAFAIFVLFATANLTLAGGWAVVTLDYLPSHVVANQPMTIGFRVRQHGQTMLSGLHPTIGATLVGSNDTLIASAQDEGSTGHYVATLTFPKAGNWEWYIDAFGLQQPMPPLNVAASAPGSGAALGVPQTVTASTLWNQELLVGAAFLGLVAAFIFVTAWRRRRLSWWIAPLAIGVVLGGSSMALVDRLPQAAMSAGSENVNPGELARQGRDLFLAKGCIVCHQNGRVQYSQTGFQSLQIGPDLTNGKLTAEFLHIWLNDPSKVKPGTQMPTLGLSDPEIDALAAFLTGENGNGESQ